MPPFVTTVLPALNEEVHISNCLKALQKQTYPSDCYEIVVVDNGSIDNTVEIVHQHDVKLLFEPRRSAYCARNHAILNSEADYIALIDADCIADSQWLENFVTALEESDAYIAGGMIVYDVVENTFGNRLLAERNSSEQRRAIVCQHHSVAAGNMLVRRVAFERYGLFKEAAYSSDIEFSKRLAGLGLYPIFVEKAIVRHQCDLSNWEYLWRSFETKRSQVLHSPLPHSWETLGQVIGQMPWKPGLSYLLTDSKNSTSRSFFIHFPEWLYRWTERWFAYAGRVHGYWLVLRKHADELVDYGAEDPSAPQA